MRKKSLLVSALALAALATACTSGGGSDTPPVPDAGPTCTVPSTLTVSANDQNSAVVLVPAAADGTPEHYIWNYITGTAVENVDEWVQFAINQPVQVGTSLDLSQGCSMTSPFCWLVLGTCTTNNGTALDGDVYFGRAGTFKITAAGQVGGHFTATFSNARFDHFVDTGTGLMPATDGCSTTIANGTVDLVVVAPAPPPKPGAQVSPLRLPATNLVLQ